MTIEDAWNQFFLECINDGVTEKDVNAFKAAFVVGAISGHNLTRGVIDLDRVLEQIVEFGIAGLKGK